MQWQLVKFPVEKIEFNPLQSLLQEQLLFIFDPICQEFLNIV